MISTKVIKLKAIHNAKLQKFKPYELCDIHKSNQIESNSQRFQKRELIIVSCVISTKVIKLKAIHNGGRFLPLWLIAV